MFIVLKFFLYNCVIFFYSPCCAKHFCLNCLYFGQDLLDWHDKLLYWYYEIVIQIVSKWQIESLMNGEIHAYWVVVCIELIYELATVKCTRWCGRFSCKELNMNEVLPSCPSYTTWLVCLSRQVRFWKRMISDDNWWRSMWLGKMKCTSGCPILKWGFKENTLWCCSRDF